MSLCKSKEIFIWALKMAEHLSDESDSARSIFRLVEIGWTLFSAERTEHGRVERGVLELVRALIDFCGLTRDLLGF